MDKARPSTQNNKTNRNRDELFKANNAEEQALYNGKASRTFLQGMHATDERQQQPPQLVNDYVNINDQIQEKAQDYDPSNEGMSASYYRMQEQKTNTVPPSRLYDADISGDNTSDNAEKRQKTV